MLLGRTRPCGTQRHGGAGQAATAGQAAHPTRVWPLEKCEREAKEKTQKRGAGLGPWPQLRKNARGSPGGSGPCLFRNQKASPDLESRRSLCTRTFLASNSRTARDCLGRKRPGFQGGAREPGITSDLPQAVWPRGSCLPSLDHRRLLWAVGMTPALQTLLIVRERVLTRALSGMSSGRYHSYNKVPGWRAKTGWQK